MANKSCHICSNCTRQDRVKFTFCDADIPEAYKQRDNMHGLIPVGDEEKLAEKCRFFSLVSGSFGA